MLPTKFRFIWPSGFRGKDLKKSANQKQELPVVAMFVNGSGQNVQSLELSVHLAEVFQRRLKCEKLTDDGRQVMAKDCLWQRELKKKFVMIYVSRITDSKNTNLVNNINNMIQQH
jgi:hypothetical protein